MGRARNRSEANRRIGKCPRCGGWWNKDVPGGFPAVSRRDNRTAICSSCGTLEGLEDAFLVAPYMGPVYWEKGKSGPATAPEGDAR